MIFKIGDKVSFLNEVGGGVVCEIIDKRTVSVRTDDGFDLPFLISDLINLDRKEEARRNITRASPKIDALDQLQDKVKVEGRTPSKSKRHSKSTRYKELEIDLHIEELVENFKWMSNHEIVTIQLRHFKNSLDKAIREQYHKLIVIHGVGNGKLKQEVHAYLSNAGNFTFYDASYAKYGFGATEIALM